MSVLVVGAGPTGLLVASELYRRGVECVIIDAHPMPLPWGRATVVHPRSLEVFGSLGLVDPLLAAGVKQRVARLHSGGSVLGEIDLSICGSCYGFNDINPGAWLRSTASSIGLCLGCYNRVLRSGLGRRTGHHPERAAESAMTVHDTIWDWFRRRWHLPMSRWHLKQ